MQQYQQHREWQKKFKEQNNEDTVYKVLQIWQHLLCRLHNKGLVSNRSINHQATCKAK